MQNNTPQAVGHIDRSSAVALRAAVDAPTPPLEPRQRAEFDFTNLAADQCHGILPDGPIHRIAFDVGNGAYFPDIGWLENPPFDAKDIAAMFYSLGRGVFYVQEGARATIENCASALAAEHGDLDVAVFYYACHGIQADDKNYLIGINAHTQSTVGPHLVSVDGKTGTLRQISRSTVVLRNAWRGT